jgi:hypothetical protein
MSVTIPCQEDAALPTLCCALHCCCCIAAAAATAVQCVRVSEGGSDWESGDNRKFKVSSRDLLACSGPHPAGHQVVISFELHAHPGLLAG